MRASLLLVTVPAVALADPSLGALAQKKVFFGHQSVGENVLAGLAALASEAKVSLRIAEGATAEAFAAPGIVHARVGKNEDPHSKLRDFEALLDGPARAAEVALVKLCYVDFGPGVDAQKLFEAYLERVEAVKKKHPTLALVHVTAPLTTVQGGLKGFVKNAIGRAPAGQRENQARHAYNTLLRARFGGKEPLFDLAAVEAGDGPTACRFSRDGQQWPCLRPELTDDGGHLNARGQREAALALAKALAAAQGTPGSAR